MWEVEAECQARLLSAVKFGAFDPVGFPDAVVTAVFAQPLWLMRGRLEMMQKVAGKDHILRRIKFAINSAPTVNAFAVLDKDYPIISLNAGLCVRLRQLMYHAVHNYEAIEERESEQAFPNETVEEALALAPPSDLLKPVDLAAGRDENHYFSLAAPFAPSAERYSLAENLTIIALDFIVLHEVCHIIRNQARFYGGTHELSFMEAGATSASPASERGQLLRQALELDADLAAGPESARQFAGGRGLTPAWEKWTDDKLEVLNLWLVALCLTFFLLDAWREDSSIELSTHPLPRVRLVNILSMIFDDMVDWNLMSSQRELFELAIKAHSRASKIWLSLGLPEKSTRLATAAVVDEYHFYIDLLAKYNIRGGQSA